MKTRFFFLCFLAVITCACTGGNSLVGRWASTTGDDLLIFSADGTFDVESNGQSLQKAMTENQQGYVGVSYEKIDEVEPHQLYFVFNAGGESWKHPFGIYKIENGKLIVRQATEFRRMMGGFDLGTSRYEMPTDFSGFLNVYERL